MEEEDLKQGGSGKENLEKNNSVFNFEEQVSKLNQVIIEQRNEIRALKQELRQR